MAADLHACLPEALRGPGTRIAPVNAGLSGAHVYRVEVAGRAWVLKLTAATEPFEAWRARVDLQRAAGAAGVAPRVVHVDDARRAVLAEFVVDRSFMARLGHPTTRASAIDGLGRTLRAVHALPLPPAAASKDPRAWLATTWAGLANARLPEWNAVAVHRVLDEPAPPADRAPVVSHNDPNPSNLVWDGERVLLLDWDGAGANDPLYDLAVVALFLGLDDASCATLIAAHDEAAVCARLSARFEYLRRLVAALCGTLFVQLARAGGHQGGDEPLELTPSLRELRARANDVRSAGGQWQFGQALLKRSVQLER